MELKSNQVCSIQIKLKTLLNMHKKKSKNMSKIMFVFLGRGDIIIGHDNQANLPPAYEPIKARLENVQLSPTASLLQYTVLEAASLSELEKNFRKQSNIKVRSAQRFFFTLVTYVKRNVYRKKTLSDGTKSRWCNFDIMNENTRREATIGLDKIVKCLDINPNISAGLKVQQLHRQLKPHHAGDNLYSAYFQIFKPKNIKNNDPKTGSLEKNPKKKTENLKKRKRDIKTSD